MIEMKEKKQIAKKSLSCGTRNNSPQEIFTEMNEEDKEIYLFLRGGFAAK
ncbi:MAG: hypothetical protein O8C61_03585 [Candidatus Methanoperedens sp.]|nr:hypothetical protein [Candidatus Methanoperedens sp.]